MHWYVIDFVLEWVLSPAPHPSLLQILMKPLRFATLSFFSTVEYMYWLHKFVAKYNIIFTSHQVLIKEEQGDEDESKTTNEPAGSGEQGKIEDDDGFDQVDAASNLPVRIADQQYSHSSPVKNESQSVVEEHKEANTEVPKIEVITTSTQSNLSSEEDSNAREERKKKKLRKKKQTGSAEEEDEEKGELRDEVEKLKKEKETMEQTIENLTREKSALEENLEGEKSKIEVRELVIHYNYILITSCRQTPMMPARIGSLRHGIDQSSQVTSFTDTGGLHRK